MRLFEIIVEQKADKLEKQMAIFDPDKDHDGSQYLGSRVEVVMVDPSYSIEVFAGDPSLHFQGTRGKE